MLFAWLCACAALCAHAHAAERLDGKVRFPDEQDTRSSDGRLAAPADAEGFYSRARAGRYRVRVETPGPFEDPARGPRNQGPYRIDQHAVYPVDRRQDYRSGGEGGRGEEVADGTLDALQYCKCVTAPQCVPRTDLPNACGAGKTLCCFTRKPNADRQTNPEALNDIDDDYPGGDRSYTNDAFRVNRPGQPEVLVGPRGPTGLLGPQRRPDQPDVLVGPEGATGLIGPSGTRGPTGTPAVLVGPGGPTGLVGPNPDYEDGLLEELEREVLGASTAQRGVLVGPGGPTGIVGPQRGVLVGPGGPTGTVGPQGYFNNGGFGNVGYNNGGYGRPVLVGPGGPTGQIGPQRGVLVGPGGPTGVVGPWYRRVRYGGYGK